MFFHVVHKALSLVSYVFPNSSPCFITKSQRWWERKGEKGKESEDYPNPLKKLLLKSIDHN